MATISLNTALVYIIKLFTNYNNFLVIGTFFFVCLFEGNKGSPKENSTIQTLQTEHCKKLLPLA